MASAPAPTATYTYKSASGVDLQADVFLPADASKKNLPILLWLHGGGLFISNRTGISAHVRRAAECHSLCVVSADYRLAPQVALSGIVEDVRDAATWCRTQLVTLLGEGKVDPARLVVAGGSAGGYLALLAGHPSLGITPSPQAILAVYPISNPFGPFYSTPQRPMAGIAEGRLVTQEEMSSHLDLAAPVLSGFPPVIYPAPRGSRAELYLYTVQEAIWPELIFAAAPDVDKAQFTPSGFLHTEYPPVYIYHGEIDWQVGIEQSRTLVKELEQRGLHYKYTEMPCPDSIHLFDLLDSSVEMEEMYEFLLSYI